MRKEQKKAVKRIVSIVLVLLLIVGLLPNTHLTGILSAYAATIETTDFKSTDGTYGQQGYVPIQCTNSELQDKYKVTYQKKGVDDTYSEYSKETFDAGEYKAVVTLTGGDTFSEDKTSTEYTFTVSAKSIASNYKIVLNSENGTVSDGNPKISVKSDSDELAATDYITLYQLNDNSVAGISEAGTYQITVSGKGNYTGSLKASYVAYDEDGTLTYSGEYFEEKNYHSNVEVKSSTNGDIISKSLDFTSAGAKLEFDNSSSLPKDVYVKHTNEKISKIGMDSFEIDKIKPDFSVVVENANDWKKEKKIKITSTEWAGLYNGAVYYTTGDLDNGLLIDGKTVSYDNKDSIDSTIKNSTKITENTEFTASQNQTYKFFAIDKAGNVTVKQIEVSKIDTVAPVITSTMPASVWTKDGKYTSTFTVADEGGADISKVSVDNSDATVSIVSGNKYEIQVNNAGTYIIEASDNAGNTSNQIQVEVKKDSSVPKIQDPTIKNEGSMTVKDSEGNYVFDRELTISFKVKDEKVDGDTDKSKITVTCTQGEVNQAAGEYTYTIKDSGPYKFTVQDEAGNKDELTINASQTASSNPAIELSLGDYAVGHHDYFTADHLPEINAVISDSVGVTVLSCEVSGPKEETKTFAKDFKVGETYTIGQYKDSQDKNNLNTVFGNEFKDYIEGLSDGVYTLELTVTNVFGKTTTKQIQFNVDKTLPDSTVYAILKSDTDESTSNNNVSDLIKKSISRIFGKNQIDFTIYLRDGYHENGVSGIDTDYFVSVENLKLDTTDENVSLNVTNTSTEDITVDGKIGTYVKVEGTIKNGNGLSDSLSKIEKFSIMDNAGNVIDGVKITEKTDAEIIIDSVNPIVKITYPQNESTKSTDMTLYYSASGNESYETVKFTYTERFFDKFEDANGPILPVIVVKKDGTDVTSDVEIKWQNDAADQKTAAIKLPYGDDRNDYVIQTSYADGSGNQLDGADSNNFIISKTIVLDKKAPVFDITYTDAYKVVDPTGEDVKISNLPSDKNTSYYKEDIIVSIVVDEATASFDENNNTLNDFTLTVKKDGETLSLEKTPSVSWNKDSSKYNGTFTISAEGKYQISASYTDLAGNKMIAAEAFNGSKETNAVTGGVYSNTAKALIIDKKAPSVAIKLGVKDDSFAEKKPNRTSDDIQYYTDNNLNLEVTIEDDNIRYAEVLEFLQKYLATFDLNEINLEESATDAAKIATSNASNELSKLVDEKSNTISTKIVLYIPLTTEALYKLQEGSFEDLAGNEYTLSDDNKINTCVDYHAPSADDLLVEYSSDISANNDNVIQKFVNTFMRRFAKKQIIAKIYVKDNMSGADAITYQYYTPDDKIQKESVTDTKTRKDNKVIKQNGEIYYEYTLALDEEMADFIRITHITDMAGNATKIKDEMTGTIAIGSDRLIIDNVAPDVAVTYPEPTGTMTDRNFYMQTSNQQYEEVTLVYTERFFEENRVDKKSKDSEMVYPALQVNDTPVSETESTDKSQPYVELSKTSSTADKAGNITAVLYLPYSQENYGAELEYVISTTYQDGSENKLVRNSDDGFSVIKDGTYTSKTLILDNKAPELMSYEITTQPTYVIDKNNVESETGTSVYKNTGDNSADVEIKFIIDDNEKYWNQDKVDFKLFRKGADGTSSEIKTFKLSWENTPGTRNHTATVTFNGEKDIAANYYATLSYSDRAGNKMISARDTSKNDVFKISDGTYTSAEFILDHVAPVYEISYNKAYRLVKGENTAQSNDKKNAVPETGYSAYYGAKEESIQVTIKLKEDYAVAEKDGDKITGITDFKLLINNSDQNLPTVNWTYDKASKIYTGTFIIDAEGYYTVDVSYQDAAANKMMAGNTVQGSKTGTTVSDGKYTSTELVLDKTVPQITASYNSNVINSVNNRDYFNKSTVLTVQIKDKNIRNQELQDAMASDTASIIKDGKDIWSTTAAGKQLSALDGKNIDRSGSHTYTFNLSNEANYNLWISNYEDLAGNKAVVNKEYNPRVCVDYSNPTDVDFSYSVSGAAFLDKVNYTLHGYAFADNTLTVTASANDAVGGIYTFKFDVTDENGNVTTITRNMDPVYHKTESIALPLSGSDFKGSVNVTVYDWSGNSSDKQQGQIVESNTKHNSTGSAVITTQTRPSRTVNGVDYYNTDVAFNLTLTDNYSGLSSYQYTAGSQISAEYNYRTAAGTDLTKEASNAITNVFTKDMTLVASANNVNDVKVQASFVDNAGHTASVEQSYNIDITAPTIQVTYDNNNPSNEKYYKENRIATVVITERNFDPNDVVFTITNTDGVMPAISGWSTAGSGDNTTHTATVSFTADGDYTFTVECQDLAGNKSNYGVVDEFTVDETKPTYTITYDNNSYQNQYYYDANRVATIDILEHNFDASAVQFTVTRDGGTITPNLSGWSRSGDHNIATVSFNTDGEYTFTVSGVDMANNAMDDYTMDHFVVDTEKPTIEIFNIENESANNGVVQPGIRYSDTNYDPNATEVSMTGYHNGEIDMGKNAKNLGTGMEVLMDDFEYVPEMDDIYTMHAVVYDLAGNSNEDEVMFSVNRFGSVYTFDRATDELVGDNGKYYTNKEQDIVVTETNVDYLTFDEITCNLNGELRTLEKDKDFTIEESGSQATWKQYTYTISASNFVKEGTYALTIYSEDRATNTSDINSKLNKSLEFVMDKTAPTVQISGVENNETYREESREVTLSVDDNVLMSTVEVKVDGEKIQQYDANTIDEKHGTLSFDVQSKNTAQVMKVTAYDAAGNSFSTDDRSFWITTNVLILYFAHKGIFFGTIAGAGALVVFLVGRKYYFGGGRKKRAAEK